MTETKEYILSLLGERYAAMALSATKLVRRHCDFVTRKYKFTEQISKYESMFRIATCVK